MATWFSGLGPRRNVPAILSIVAATLACITPASAQERWAGAWGYAQMQRAPELASLQPPGTYFHRVKLTQRGNAVMLTISNTESLAAAKVSMVGIAVAEGPTGFAFNPATLRRFLFNGKTSITMPIGGSALTDPLPYVAEVGKDYIIGITFDTPTLTPWSAIGLPVSFEPAASGGYGPGKLMTVRPYLSQIAVREPAARCTIVAFGDSITDGFNGWSSSVRGWPGRLADRLAVLPPERRCGVVNMGISGNQLLAPGIGQRGLDRFWRDVATVPGATHVVLLEGINDINVNRASAADLIDGYRQFVTRARALGLRVIAGTLTAAWGSGITPVGEATRNQANSFIRSSGAFDGVIDFDAAIRNPEATALLRPEFDSGDHIHPNDLGYRQMADVIDLNLFIPVQ